MGFSSNMSSWPAKMHEARGKTLPRVHTRSSSRPRGSAWVARACRCRTPSPTAAHAPCAACTASGFLRPERWPKPGGRRASHPQQKGRRRRESGGRAEWGRQRRRRSVRRRRPRGHRAARSARYSRRCAAFFGFAMCSAAAGGSGGRAAAAGEVPHRYQHVRRVRRKQRQGARRQRAGAAVGSRCGGAASCT